HRARSDRAAKSQPFTRHRYTTGADAPSGPAVTGSTADACPAPDARNCSRARSRSFVSTPPTLEPDARGEAEADERVLTEPDPGLRAGLPGSSPAPPARTTAGLPL